MDKEQFEDTVCQYRDNLFAVAFQYTKNAADADDMVQTALIKAFKNPKPYESESHLRYWLIRVTINECKRYLASPWRKNTMPLDEYAETLGFETPEQSAVFHAVMALPQKYRVPVLLFYYEDYSVKEISKALGLRETTVQTRLLRARKKLRQTLEEWEDEQ